MREPIIPTAVEVLVCAVCGRTDRWTDLKATGMHYAGGKRCLGVPRRYVYVRQDLANASERGQE